MRPFFVYGTLLPGQPNFDLWRDDIKHIEPAILWAATLYDMGGYPMLVEGHDAVVKGALVEIVPEAYEATLARIDELEAYDEAARRYSIYLREARQVQVNDGSHRVAWVYIGAQRHVAGMEPFGGDWIAYSAENRQKISDWWHNFRNNPQATLVGSNA